ncbi:MAG: DUF4212 domain-containing protein [Polyangiaceae bacterium]|nr:DUF4212 domain-containing protein [Polyangiaceae bacterium]
MKQNQSAQAMNIGRGRQKSYWRRNIERLLPLLAVWFLTSFGAGILFVDKLDEIEFLGFPLGFFFAQQGSIYVFLILIVVYIRTMNTLDDEYQDVGPEENPS